MKTIRIFVFASVLFSILACNFLTESTPPKEHLYTVSGTLNPARVITVPGNARVLVMWLVIPADSEAHDYTYVFGDGTVDFTNYTFMVRFDDPPPKEALMQRRGSYFGIGYIVLTAKHIWYPKLRGHAFLSRDILGIAANQTIVYIDGEFDQSSCFPCLEKFSQGYNMAHGYNTTDPFDEDNFKPAGSNSVRIIVDDIDKIDFVHPMW